jgi:VWFA-related protein
MKARPLVHTLLATMAAVVPLGSLGGDQPAPKPSGLVENVEVRLVILDVQVLDRKGHPVPGLGRDDFDVSIDRGRPVPIATFDAACADAAQKPVVVLAFDYQHLVGPERTEALRSARRALERGGLGDLEIMVVALTGGLRIEQPLSTKRDATFAALQHMQDDVTLWGGNFSHTSDDGFVRGLTSLFDVVGMIPKPKAVVLFSGMRDVPYEEDFRNLAALAAASRSVVYPVDIQGLDATDLMAASPWSPPTPDTIAPAQPWVTKGTAGWSNHGSPGAPVTQSPVDKDNSGFNNPSGGHREGTVGPRPGLSRSGCG